MSIITYLQVSLAKVLSMIPGRTEMTEIRRPSSVNYF